MVNIIKEMRDRQRAIEEAVGITSGRYMVGSSPAYCIVNETGVRVIYDDGSYTCAYHATFKLWGAKPITEKVT